MTLQIEPRPSIILAAALTILHSAAIVSAWVSLENWPLVLAIAGVLLSGIVTIPAAVQMIPGLARMELDEQGQAMWTDSHAGQHGPRPYHLSLTASWLVVLAVERSDGTRHWVILPPDSVPRDTFRQLRVWLRWHSTPRMTGKNDNNHLPG